MGSLIDAILRPIEYVVAWIMVGWHTVLTTVGLPAGSGWTWALSIVGLVIVIRILLIPLFVRQIKASRSMQLIQPEMKKIQDKYKGKTDPESRQRQQQEIMTLYRESGSNPLSSCLPILAQSPIFFALFRVLNGIQSQTQVGPLNKELVRQADSASLLGAPLSSSFVHSGNLSTRILTVVLIALMTLTTFTSQRQLMMKNMPASAMDNPYMQQQKILLYVLPLVFAVSGVNFPIGVLLYWLTTNIWSMGQQFYVIHRMPAPGSPAEKAMLERRARRRGPEAVAADPDPVPSGRSDAPVRQQPKRQSRSQRRGGPKRDAETSDGAGGAEGAESDSTATEPPGAGAGQD
jgi:YidC/Oxa1 family membrane protein insertase